MNYTEMPSGSSKEEYLMLREELLHLDNIINNTISFFYVFIAAYMVFALEKNDTLYLLLSNIVMIPAYLLVIGKRMAICKIGAYLKVFHEGETFNWETMQLKFHQKKRPRNF